MNGHGHFSAACEARDGDLVQTAVPIIICDEIGGGESLVIHGFSRLVRDGNVPGIRKYQSRPLLAQNLQKGVFSIQQIGKGVGLGSALAVGAVRQIQVSIPVRFAIPGGIAVPAVDLKAIALHITAVRSLLNRRAAGNGIRFDLKIGFYRLGAGLHRGHRLLPAGRPDHVSHIAGIQGAACGRSQNASVCQGRQRCGNIQGVAGFAHGHTTGRKGIVAGQHAVGIRDGSRVEVASRVIFQSDFRRSRLAGGGEAGDGQVACISLTICA